MTSRRAAWLFAANALGANAGWFACAWGAASGRFWLGPAVVALLLAFHLAVRENRSGEALLAAAALPAGWLFDSSLMAAGLVAAPGPGPVAGLSPFWLASLWVNFALTLNVSLAWLGGRPLLAALLGAVGGPMAYAAGARMGAIAFGPRPALSLAVIGLGWAAATPLLSWAGRRIAPAPRSGG